MINIFTYEIPQTFDAQRSAESFKKIFTGEENALYADKLLQKKNQTARNQSVSALCVLSAGLSKLSIDTQGLLLSKSATGKPYFTGKNTPYFSISHDDNIVAVAISDNCVGIDIQAPRDSESLCKIAKRFFGDNETKDVLSGKTDFLTIWTRKEAYCKLSDTHLSDLAKKELPKNIFFKTFDLRSFKISVASDMFQNVSVTFLNEI